MSLRRVEGQAPSQSAFLFFLHLWCPIVKAGPRMTYVRSPIFNSHCSCRSLALLTSSSPTSRGSLSARVQCSSTLEDARAPARRARDGPTKGHPHAPATVQSGERDLSTLPDTLSRCLTATRTARHGLSATLPPDWQYSPPAGSAGLYARCRRLLALMRESSMATKLLVLVLPLIWS